MKIAFRLFVTGVALTALLSISCKTKEIYKDASQPVEARVEDLLKRMTLKEKIDLLSGDSSGFDTRENTRLGIPALHLSDGPMGVRTGKATSFPSAISYAASWDTALINELSIALGDEARAKGKNYLLGPCICINRMPLGGRNFESYGEDPYLTSRLAVNYVKGLQSRNVISSVKHFAMNDQEWERNNYDVIIDERTMREIHLAAFEAAVKEGGAWSVMSAYNIVNGQHCSENFHLLNDVLKKDWGFKGFVVSDWTSVYSTENAANAGLDLEMPTGVFFKKDLLLKSIKKGMVSESTIDDKVRRLLRVRFQAGLFEKQPDADTTVFEKHVALALKVAEKSIVLLRNDNILPLDKSKIKSIAVIGPNAETAITAGGGSSMVTPFYSVSPLEAIKVKAGSSVVVNFAMGDNMEPTGLYLINPIFFVGGLKTEIFANPYLKGQPKVVRNDKDINFNFFQNGPANTIESDSFSVRWTGKLNIDVPRKYKFTTLSDDGVRLWIDNKLVIENWTQHAPTRNSGEIMLGKGLHDIKLEYSEFILGAEIRLGWDFKSPELLGHNISSAVEAAKKSEVAILFVGSNSQIEGEGTDMESFSLPYKQVELINAVAKANPNTIVVLNGGTPFKVDNWIGNVKGLIDMFYSGQETGNAIADILFGDVNPSGKLPFSFIASEDQSPAFKGYKDKSLKIEYNEGVFVGYRYLDINNINPSFPFGFGLSYTNFEYSNLKIVNKENNSFEVSAEIKNTGKVTGEEVVQLYIAPQSPAIKRPLKELKSFAKLSLKAGETKTVTLKLNSKSFSYWDVNSKSWKADAGKYEILVGASSRDIRLKETVSLN